jgi:hypothetical protein
MNRRAVILWGVGAGQLLSAAIALALMETSSGGWIDTFLAAIMYGQFYLTGIWVALGYRISPWRLLAIGIFLTCLTWGDGDVLENLHGMMFIFGANMVITLGALFLARMCGFRLHDFEIRHAGNMSKLQFSLRSILIWTAVIAMLLSLASLMNPDIAQMPPFNWPDLLFLVPLLLLFTGTCLLELAIMLAMRRPWLGHIVCVPIVLSLFGLLGWFQGEAEVFVGVGTCTVLWFALSFWPLRLLGWRFGRPKPMDGESPSEDKACLPEQGVSRFTIAIAMRRWKIWHRGMRNLPNSRRTVILWTLAVGQLLIAAVAYIAIDRMPGEWVVYLCGGLVYGQPYLASVWIASGHRSLPWRFVLVAALLTGLLFLPQGLGPGLPEAIVALSPGIVAVLAFLLPARAFNLNVYNELTERPATRSHWLQFSLRSALEWTAATAVFCSLAVLAGPKVSNALRNIGGEISMIFAIHIPFAAACVAVLVIVLVMGRPWIGLTILFPVVLAVAGLIGWITEELEGFLTLAMSLMIWFAVCFAPLRLFGYRFGRPPKLDVNPDPVDEPQECPFQEPPDLAD